MTESSSDDFPLTQPSLALSDRHRTCFWNSLSHTLAKKYKNSTARSWTIYIKFWLVLTNLFKGVQHDLRCSCIWYRTIFTMSESGGSTWPARLCAQLISCTAEWIFPDDLYCFAKWMINNATLVSKTGREANTGFQLLHHLQNVLKAYLHCFAVLSALDVI